MLIKFEQPLVAVSVFLRVSQHREGGAENKSQLQNSSDVLYHTSLLAD